MAQAPGFALGQQPEWAGTEAVITVPDDFVPTLLAEAPEISLQKRGYCVLKIDPDVRELYSSFHTIFEKFASQPEKEKEVFANVQFDHSSHTPNQYHGYSVLCGLKEQFMMRIGGDGCSDLTVPEDLGRVGTKLYEKLDLLCRELSRKFVHNTNHPDQNIGHKILDPIHKTGVDPTFQNPNVASSFLPPGYVGSSLLDNFYYYNHFKKTAPVKVETQEGQQEYDQFMNNHASHTDSGLLTCVITTDTPGLELVDQSIGKWIAIENLVHEYVKRTDPEAKDGHRNYATIFWGDSLCYLLQGLKGTTQTTVPEACLHRVQQCKSERYSVVFKQRTAPLATAPRYQEDYPLAHRQLAAVDKLYGKAYDLTKGFPNLAQEEIEKTESEVSKYIVGSVVAASFVGLVCAAWYAYQRSGAGAESAPPEACISEKTQPKSSSSSSTEEDKPKDPTTDQTDNPPEFQLREMTDSTFEIGEDPHSGNESPEDEKKNDQIISDPPDWVTQNLVLSHMMSKKRTGAVIFGAVFVFVLGWLYIGAFWDPLVRVTNIPIAFLSEDVGFNLSVLNLPPGSTVPPVPAVGSTFRNFILNEGKNTLDWRVYYQNTTTLHDIMELVRLGQVWGAIFVPHNFSQNYLTSGHRSTASNTTNVTLAYYLDNQVEFLHIYDTGRNPSSVSIINSVVGTVVDRFSKGFFSALLTQNVNTTNFLVSVINPVVFAQGINRVTFDFHPIVHYGQSIASFLIFIMLWIGCLMAISSLTKINEEEPYHFRISGKQDQDHDDWPEFGMPRVLWGRFILGLLICLLQSFFITLIPLILGGSFYANFGVTWMWSFFSQAVFLAWLLAMANIIGAEALPIPAMIFLVLQLVSCGGALAEELLPPFFLVGRAFPMYYAVRGLRAVYFGSLIDPYHMGVNAGVMFAWYIPCSIVSLFLSRRRMLYGPELSNGIWYKTE